MVDELIELTARKKNLAEELLRLTSKQSELVLPEKSELLLEVIAKKQECINSMDQIHEQLVLLENKILTISRIPSLEKAQLLLGAKWTVLESLRNSIHSIFKKIQNTEESNREKIKEEHRKLKSQIDSLRVRKGSCKAYQGPAGQVGGYFIDKKK